MESEKIQGEGVDRGGGLWFIKGSQPQEQVPYAVGVKVIKVGAVPVSVPTLVHGHVTQVGRTGQIQD